MNLLLQLLWLVKVVILAEVVVSWLITLNLLRWGPEHPVRRVLTTITEPLLAPVRRLLPPERMGGWDLSPLIVLVALNFLVNLLR